VMPTLENILSGIIVITDRVKSRRLGLGVTNIRLQHKRLIFFIDPYTHKSSLNYLLLSGRSQMAT
jgi:hypothetical protein